MSEKRFTLSNPISHNPIPSWVSIIHDDIEHKHLNAEEICDLLNDQQATISRLKEENEQLRQTTKTQQIRIYCQDKEIQKLNEQLNKIPESIRSVWIE